MGRTNKSHTEDEERLLDDEYELETTNLEVHRDPLQPAPRIDRRKQKDELALLEAMLRRKERERVVQSTIAKHVARRDEAQGRSCPTGYKILVAVGLAIVVGAFILAALFEQALRDRLSRFASGRHETRPHAGEDYVLDRNWNFNAVPTRREYTWTVRDTMYNPDGVYRPMMLINAQFPGPLIEANEGDTIVVHLYNEAQNATAMHWHGLYQNGSNFMDGTVGITQCPIAPGTQFTYEFNVTGQSGTYWYHAHQGLQASDGLYGPLVIHSRDELRLQRLPYDTDRVIMVSDHYHTLTSELLLTYLASDRENIEPVPDSALINGRGIRNCEQFPHRACDNTTANVGLPRFDLEPGKAHRLRIINVGAFAEFQVSIDEMKFAVTEADGTDLEPAYFNRLSVNPAQRYSIVLLADRAEGTSFWLRAKMLATCFGEDNKYLDAETRAIISYGIKEADNPTSKDWDEQTDLECHDMDTSQLVPAEQISAPPDVDESFHLRASFEIGAWRLSRGRWNSSTWHADVRSPTLRRTLDGLAAQNETFTAAAYGSPAAWVNEAAFDLERELVIQTRGIAVIDIMISNFDGNPMLPSGDRPC